MTWIATLVALPLAVAIALLRWGARWGSTAEERASRLPGDDFLAEDSAHRRIVAMTRAISIAAPPERVWPWIAQLGRGAGWYSIDRLDNGGRVSARHIVSWIPEPREGDATAIGYLRHVDPGRALAWWVDDVPFCGARTRLVSSFHITARGQGSRLISRMSADADGATAGLALLIFRIVDSIMASRQLIGIRDRAESRPREDTPPPDPETGAVDQYQLYEVLYANGASAGVAGKEQGATWRQAAILDGVLPQEPRNDDAD
jgi:hypothetical protein